jgi:hypothetical protein
VTHRQVALQATLALAGLCAAYFTWQRAAELAPGEVFVIDSGKNDVSAVRFDDQEKSVWVELTTTSDENGPFTSVHLSPQERATTAKDQTKDQTKDHNKDQKPSKTPERMVRGSEAADKLLAGFAPLRASRGLGILDPTRLKDLGLDEPKRHFTLTLRNGKRAFAIAPAPPGGSEPYLRDEVSGQVYVVSRSLLSDFQSAASLLVERRLHGFKVEEADRVAIQRGGKKEEFVISRSEDRVQLSPVSSPDKPDSTAKTWHDRAFAVWPVEVLGKDEAPEGGQPQVELRIDYAVRGHRLGFVEIARLAALASSSDGAKDTLFARSEHTLGWVKLPADTQSLLADADGVLH